MMIPWCSSDLPVYFFIILKVDSEAEVDQVNESVYFDFSVLGKIGYIVEYCCYGFV